MSNYPKVAQGKPTAVTLEAEKVYAWCTCGLSEKQPFCDGKHKTIPPEEGEFKSLKFSSEKETAVWLCNCKQTKNPPYCDGSHNLLKKED